MGGGVKYTGLLFATLLLGCGDVSIHATRSELISDATGAGGTPGFYWLPPLVPAPAVQGTFDAGQTPSVVIEERDPATLTIRRVVATLSTHVDPVAQAYGSAWHTAGAALDPSLLYRINVRLGKSTLGFADVQVVAAAPALRKVDSQRYVALVAGRTLAINFWLGTCAAVECTRLDACHLAGVCQPSTGTCTNPLNKDGALCDDGNACTQTDSCQGGVCVGATPVVCVATDPCQEAKGCDPATGQCNLIALLDGTPCDDGNGCTVGDQCTGGTCGGAPRICPAGPGESALCALGHCVSFCIPSMGNCNNDESDGCETALLSTDYKNCGACGHRCADNEVCTLGTCGPSQCDTGYFGPGTICPSDGCRDLRTDAYACGGCGNYCQVGAGEQCSDGVCQCTSGGVHCAGTDLCIDLGWDVNNCGSCGHQCAPGLACVYGVCCTECVGARLCVDIDTDNFHCGSCDRACSIDEDCQAGQCQCVGGAVHCAGSCVFTAVDRENCGSCGNVCTAQQQCQDGRCVDPISTCATCGALSCVDLTSNDDNCGACGNACPQDKLCYHGGCVGCDPYLVCNHQCIAGPAMDANCGACGNQCPAGTHCSNGVVCN
jgi:hypothetical protein